MAIAPQDPIATELLEQALQKSSEIDFNPAVMADDGDISIPDDEEIDEIIDRRLGRPSADHTTAAIHDSEISNVVTPTNNASEQRQQRRGDGYAAPSGLGARMRRQLGDVTGRFMQTGTTPGRSGVGEDSMMEVSDEEL